MKRNLVAAAAFAASSFASLLAWSRMPERVPVHVGLDGTVDRYGSRWEAVLIGPGAILVLWGILALVGRVDPRRVAATPEEREESRAGREALESAALIFCALLHGAMLVWGLGFLREPGRLFGAVFAAFLILGGNVLGRVRPNWFIGIRTPWTLSSDEVWRRTHRLGGRLMVAAGLLLVPASLLLPSRWAVVAAGALLVAALLAPVVWSYALWRRLPAR